LADEGVHLDVMVAHGGLFRTEGVAQRLLAAALRTPVAVGQDAGEGGAWGIAVLASYLAHADESDLAEFLQARFSAGAPASIFDPDPVDVEGFSAFMEHYVAALPVQRAALSAT